MADRKSSPVADSCELSDILAAMRQLALEAGELANAAEMEAETARRIIAAASSPGDQQ